MRTRLFLRTCAVGTGIVLTAAMTTACGSSGGSGGGKDCSSGSSASAPAVAPPPTSASVAPPSGQPGKGKPAITMGDKNFAEEYLLGELYSQALKAKGFSVTLKGNIGASAVIDKALTSGQIDMYPEYTGVIYTELAKLGDHPSSAKETLDGAIKWENGRGFDVLYPTQFQDADGLAVTNSWASDHNCPSTIDDMSKINGGKFSYGGPPENKSRYQGVIGLEKAYGLHPDFKALDIGAQYQAADQGKIDAIAIFTTDGQLESGNYTILADTKSIFGFQQVVPVVKKSVADAEGPAFAQTLNAVSSLLTTDAIVAMNKAVQIDQKDPGEVASAFLKANKFTS